MTVLTSEFTHFNLVIRLSKAKQLALLFSSLLGLSRWSVGPGFLAEMPVYQSEAVRNNQKFRFFAAALVSEVTCALLHDTEIRQVHGLRCGPFLLFVVVW